MIVSEHLKPQETKVSLMSDHSSTMDEREAMLGFKPQKEVPYNALLPYADSLDDDSNDQLARIKAILQELYNFGTSRSVQVTGAKY